MTSSKVESLTPRPRHGNVRPPSSVNLAPASRPFSSVTVLRATGPLPLVVRSSVSSWITTSAPSRVTRRSNSTASTPSATAWRNDSSVFSGAWARLPRWPMTGLARGSSRIMGAGTVTPHPQGCGRLWPERSSGGSRRPRPAVAEASRNLALRRFGSTQLRRVDLEDERKPGGPVHVLARARFREPPQSRPSSSTVRSSRPGGHLVLRLHLPLRSRR